MPAELPTIDRRDDPLAGRLRSLSEGGSAKRSAEILVEEEPNVLAADRAGIDLHHLFLTRRTRRSSALADLVDRVPASVLADDVVDDLFPRTRAPLLCALATLPPPSTFRSLEGRPGDLVVLEDLGGPGNIGAVIRCAAAFEAAGVLVLDTSRPELYRRGVIRSAAGTIFSLPLLTATKAQLAKYCRASGTALVTTSSHDDGPFDEVVSSPGRLAIALGAETTGVSRELDALADQRCRIPMSPDVESLNVSAAASILLFARSRRAGAATGLAPGSATEGPATDGGAPSQN